MTAYHRLENIHEITISESGKPCNMYDTHARFYIYLNEKRGCWVYKRYLKERDSIGNHKLDKKECMCRVYPDFEPVTKWNK